MVSVFFVIFVIFVMFVMFVSVCSRRKPEVDDIAVVNDIFLAFEAELAVLAARGHGSSRDQVIVADDFRADESASDVAVNLAGGELCRRSARDRPGAAFVLADRKERNIPEQVVAGPNNAIEA